jgi:hypothetical protein
LPWSLPAPSVEILMAQPCNVKKPQKPCGKDWLRRVAKLRIPA